MVGGELDLAGRSIPPDFPYVPGDAVSQSGCVRDSEDYLFTFGLTFIFVTA